MEVTEQRNLGAVGVYNDLDLVLGGLAAVIGAGVVAAIGLAIGGNGFIGLPVALASVVATKRKWGQCRAGRTSVLHLVEPDASYARWCVASAVGCALLPAVFPSGAYERFEWMVGANAAALGTCLFAIPMLRVVGVLTRWIAGARRQRGARAE